MEELIYLHPQEIGVHPALKYLEDNGVFTYTEHELTQMVASFKLTGPLQPILVTPAKDDSEKKWWRVAGKLRIAAAKKIGCNLPCYVRLFESDEEVIRAARYENFIRRHFNFDRLKDEDELINKLLSQRTSYRLKATKQLHPEWQKLLKTGLIRHYNDSLITQLKELDYELQETLAEVYNNIMSLKISKSSNETEDPAINNALRERLRKEFEQEIKPIYEKNKELTLVVEKLQKELEKTQREAQKVKNELPNIDEITARYEKRIAEIRAEKHEKESEIKQLKNDIYKIHQKYAEEKVLAREERYKHLSNDLKSLADSTLSRFETLSRIFLTMLKDSNDLLTRDGILVLNDSIEKFVEKLTKQASALKSEIINHLKQREMREEQREKPEIIISDN